MRHGLKIGLYTQWDSTGQKQFFIFKQLSNGDSFWVRDLSYLHIPFQHWGNIRSRMCKLCAWCYSEFMWVPWVHVFVSLAVFRNPFFLGFLIPSASDIFSTSSSSTGVSDLKGRKWWSIPLKPELSKVSLHIVQLCVSVFEGIFSDDAWARHWPVSIAECHQKPFYCCVYFSIELSCFSFSKAYVAGHQSGVNDGLYFTEWSLHSYWIFTHTQLVALLQ